MVKLGPKSTSALQGLEEHQKALQNIKSGNTDMIGNYGVQLEWKENTYHIGDTGVHYMTTCGSGSYTTIFIGFVRAQGDLILRPDSFETPLQPIYNGEFGTPFDYIPKVWEETYQNLGY
jgi:hypothetical protein